MKKAFLLSSILALLAVGCNESADHEDNNQTPTGATLDYNTHTLALTRSNNCSAYRSHLLDAAARYIAGFRFLDDYVITENEPGEPGEYSPTSSESSQAAEFSVTNTQEEGIDELDTIKNDGTYMYVAREDKIHVYKVWPAEELQEVAVLPCEKNLEPKKVEQTMLLSNNKLIVFDNAAYEHFFDDGYASIANTNATNVRIVDISDPLHPKQLKRYEMDGTLVDARLVDGTVHFVLGFNHLDHGLNPYDLLEEKIPNVPDHWNRDKYKTYEEFQIARKEQIDKYLPLIRTWLEEKMPGTDWIKMPQLIDGIKSEPSPEGDAYSMELASHDLVTCADTYVPSTSTSEMGMVVIGSLSVDNYEQLHTTALTDSGWLVYASQHNLYLTSSTYNWYWDCFYDKECKNYSHIHRFSLGKGISEYKNSGELEGLIESSFWMSEYNNYLRVATQPDYYSREGIGSTLSVLSLDGEQMNVVGSVGELGVGESIYAARMIGDKGYVVTFKRTDPLYTLDLSDPTNPKKMGELKINGYSSYIHPMGDNHLLTIGEDADDNGQIKGMHLQIFDVSNLSNPTRVAQEMITENKYNEKQYSDGWSEALYNHHAFQYHHGSGLLAIPVNISSYKYNTDNWSDFSGIFVYRAKTDTGFELLGGIDHSDFIDKKNEQWWTYVDRSRFYFADSNDYSTGAYIYTISDLGIKVNDANQPATLIKSVKIDNKSQDD